MKIRIIDNDKGLVRAEANGARVRSWEYETRAEQRQAMRLAHEFAEGWFLAVTAMTEGAA